MILQSDFRIFTYSVHLLCIFSCKKSDNFNSVELRCRCKYKLQIIANTSHSSYVTRPNLLRNYSLDQMRKSALFCSFKPYKKYGKQYMQNGHTCIPVNCNYLKALLYVDKIKNGWWQFNDFSPLLHVDAFF